MTVHVWFAPFATFTFEQFSYVVVYPAIGVSASTTECVPAATVSVFLPCNVSVSCKNAVDDPPYCDFYYGSIVQRGDLQIAISTAGDSPALAQRLRKEIDAQLPEDTGEWLAQVGQLRREVIELEPTPSDRRTQRRVDRLRDGHDVAARQSRAARLASALRRFQSDVERELGSHR